MGGHPPLVASLDLRLVATLARAALDQLWSSEADGGCCPRCCGPCHALDELLRRGQLDELLSHDPAVPGLLWWREGRVDREWLGRVWCLTSCHDEES